jgi:hypothetical protein
MIKDLYFISVSYPDLAESSRDHDQPLFYSFHVTMIATGYEQKFLFRKTQFPRHNAQTQQDSHLCTYAHLGRRDVKFQGFYKNLRASSTVLSM